MKRVPQPTLEAAPPTCEVAIGLPPCLNTLPGPLSSRCMVVPQPPVCAAAGCTLAGPCAPWRLGATTWAPNTTSGGMECEVTMRVDGAGMMLLAMPQAHSGV